MATKPLKTLTFEGLDDTYTVPQVDSAMSDSSTNPVQNKVVKEYTDALRSSLANEYNSAATYAVGDFCIYNNLLYECTTAITTAEAWTAGHWTLTNVGDEISGLKEDLSYNGIRYYPKNNLLKKPHLDLTNLRTGVESIVSDGCNVMHLTRTSSAVYFVFDITETLALDSTIYFSAYFRGSAKDLTCRLSAVGEGTPTIKDFKTTSTLEFDRVTFSATMPLSTNQLRVGLQVKGELWITDIIVSKTPINYDYSVKRTVETLSKNVSLLDGGITPNNFVPELKSLFPYKLHTLPVTFTEGYYMNKEGTLTANSTSKYTTISVEAGDIIQLTGSHGSSQKLYVLVDSSNNVIEYYPSSNVSTQWETYMFTVPADGTLYFNTYSVNGSSVSEAIGYIVASPSGIGGKTWFALGDSITAYATGYHAIIAEETGVVVTNGGVSGSGYYKKSDESKSFVDRSNLEEVYDIVTVFGSINDMEWGSEHLGTATDTGTETLGGRFNTVIDNIYASGNYHLGIISPIPNDSTNGNPNNPNGSFAKFTELLKEVCTLRGVPYLDLWHCSNMQPWDADFATAFMQDNTHPNTDGHKIFAPRIKAFIESL